MLVDDEVTITEGLKVTIDWEQNQCVVVATCKDGDEAVQLAIEVDPDIVISDIRMLNMDGLSMIKQLKSIESRAKFIVLSGYSEFELAKRAILLGIHAYLLKPVEEEELEDALRRCVESIEQEKMIQHQLDIAGHLQTNLRELVLFQLLDPDNENKDQIHRLVDDAELELPGPVYTVLLINTEAQELSKRTKLAEYCWKNFNSYVVPYSNNQSVVLLNHPLPTERQEIKAAAELLLQFLKEIGFPEARISNRLDRAVAQQTIDNIIQHWTEYSLNSSTHAIKSYMISILLNSLQTLTYDERHHDEWYSQVIILLSESNFHRSIEECKRWLNNMVGKIIDLKSRTLSSQKKDIIDEVKAYIHNNYQSAFTLASLSEQFFINPFYLSRLFKKRTGDSYLNYITRVRMEEAQRLLLTTDFRIYEIAEKVGYDTTKYFSKIFEKWVGLKPSDYRSRQGKGI
ncbi:response regulator transcription factor [Paenibacillus periandrae]|uniref:response regulator transcription factor n=1 Tax=Paenibacillus periandrae TaxID=1761741 RepID=UPI001F099D5F|nr:response regulator [Paenibacillus periandrae]